jgi:hypothetical protein
MSWDLIQPYLISFLAAAGLLLLGSILGRLLQQWSTRAARAFLDRVGRNSVGAGAVGAAVLGQSVPVLVGRFIYWLVFLFFIAAAVEVLGFPVVTRVADRLAVYLPGTITALAIVFLGIVISSLAGGIAAAAAASAGVVYAGAVGRTVQGVLVLLAILIGLEQIGVQGQLVVVLLAAVIGVLLGGAALAFGLGARRAVSNIVASYYVVQTYRVGQTVRVAGFQGRIARTTPTAVILDTKDGQVQVPSSIFTEEATVLVTESGS